MVLVLSLVSCATDKSDGTLIRPVKTGRVEMSVPMERTSLSGTVSAGMEAHPSFRRTGVIKSIYVREGEHVEKGQLLAELDTRDIEEASEAAKSKYEQVAAEVGRVEELYKRKSVAKNEYEKAISGLQTVTSLYETTQNQLADSKLYAPISGTVQTVSYAPNMTVTPVSGVVSIINTNELQIEGYISSSLFVKRDRFVRMVAYSAIMKDSIPLDISYISPKANNSQLYKVRFDLAPEYSRRLAPGMVVEISLYYRTASDADVMTVPMSSSSLSVSALASQTISATSTQPRTASERSVRSPPSSPTSSMPAVSMKTTGPIGASSQAFSTGSVVVPGTSLTMAIF